MPLSLLRFAASKTHPEPRMFRRFNQLKESYDVVIIGAGGHGLAAAYYLARDYGITNICVLEKGYIGGGNTGRNTTIVRSNYLTPEGVQFYDASIRLWEDLAEDFDLNLFYSRRGHFTLAHSDSAMRTMRWRAEVNKHYGVESEVVDADFVHRVLPMMDLECGGHAPVLGALYHAPGAIVRHDAVAWGYGRGADLRGVEIHQQTAVTGIDVRSGKVVGVNTTRGYIHTDRVLSAVAGSTPAILDMVGLESPIFVHPLQAMVSEPTKPWLDPIIVSGSLHVYVSQSARGELVMGASLDPYELHSTRSTLDFVEGLAAHMLDLFPFLSPLKVVRQWAGMADMTPDFSPIMGKTPVEGFYLDAGWGTWGFKATPIAGKTMAHTLAENQPHPLIAGFSLDRFTDFSLTGERGAAAVGH
ncbi:FAD-dependent oxidoreductase [Acidithiobacillus caldus]|uniref:Sarcosine oxidase beta subunit n=2 Tax=Acidithiobacillus caldus TaxID=33059 RepID=A0A060A3L9_ACICK|nr:FAD-dependent oxidoreductase [Acidithiobacillus caldus]AIA56756.1 Sarcosine oxidase beta subunit [Acidithiobacillus caldus ATCC 51756]MBU2731127.1 FAD-dependent oxidoreductase [Acidithiobacillus caldus]MBU2735974.1 FAD-dependent oxidoreductase [Acidithiobacillus caldus ATCC 51756]MBU2744220.1 FAD-dependent oxidoreductase [Acidithiobacillus caldus]